MLSKKVLTQAILAGMFSLMTFSVCALTVKVIPAGSKQVKWSVSYQSHVSPYLSASISYRVAGEVKNVFVHVGDRVNAGDKMAQLSLTTLKLKVLEAEANLSQSQAKYKLEQKRYQSHISLHANNHLSDIDMMKIKNDLASAKTSFIKNQVMLKVAKINLGRATLQAPYDLVVDKRLIDHGQTVSKNTKAFDVYALDKLDVQATVSGDAINAMRQGMQADIFVKPLNKHFSGFIRSVGHKPTYASSYPIIVRIAKPSTDIKPGMQVSVRFAAAQPKALVSVPLSALVGHRDFIEKQGKDINGLGRAAVFVYNPTTQTVNKVKVVVNRIESKTVLLSGGLSVGQKIVVSNIDQLKNNQKVTSTSNS